MYDWHGRPIPDSAPPETSHGKKKKKHKKRRPPPPKVAHGDAIMFSGCADQQTSADAVIQGKAAGAMSSAIGVSHQLCGKLKNRITEPTCSVTLKGIDPYDMRSCHRYIYCINWLDALNIEL